MQEPIRLPRRVNPDDTAVRPQSWDGYIGQERTVKILRVASNSAHNRQDKLPHVLIAGPPGLGKTTLAQIVAQEMRSGFKMVQGSELDSPASVGSAAMELTDHSIFFIEEAHSAKPIALEILYEIMEPAGSKGFVAQSIRDISIIAATTNPGRLPQPFIDRCQLKLELAFYTPVELALIVMRAAERLTVKIEDLAADAIAAASNGTPRIALNYLLFTRDVARVGESSGEYLTLDDATEALNLLGIDASGYTELQRRYLWSLAYRHNGGPASLDTLAAGISKDRESVNREVEPLLLRNNMIAIAGRGRKLTGPGRRYVRENIPL